MKTVRGKATASAITATMLVMSPFLAPTTLADAVVGTSTTAASTTAAGTSASTVQQVSMSGPAALTVDQSRDYFSAFLGNVTTTNPVIYQVEITKNGSPVVDGDVSSLQWAIGDGTGAPKFQPVTLSAGVAVIGSDTDIALAKYTPFFIFPTFHTSGDYVITLTVTDKTTQQALATASTKVSVGQPNVSLSVVDQNGNPVSGNVSVAIAPAGSDGSNQVNAAVTPGTKSVYLPTGQYEVLAVMDDDYTPLSPAQTFDVTDTGADVKVVEPIVGQITGTVHNGTTVVAGGTLVAYPVDAAGTPELSSPAMYLPVDSTGQISATLPVGDYLLTNLYDNGGQGYGLSQSFSVSKAGPNVLDIEVPDLSLNGNVSSVTGATDWRNVRLSDSFLAQFPKDVYFKVSVKKGTTPVSTGLHIDQYTVKGTERFTLDSTGSGYAYKQSPVTLDASTSTFFSLATEFDNPGTYTITYTILDAKTNAPLGTTSTQVQAVSPNVVGTVVAPDGTTPISNVNVTVKSATGQETTFFTDENGQFRGNLSAGTWQVVQLMKWEQTGDQSQPTTTDVTGQNVSFTISQDQNTPASPKVKDTSINVVGSAYEDAEHKVPLANGGFGIFPDGVDTSTNQKEIFINTDSKGRFAFSLNAGTYNVQQEGDANMFQQISGVSFTVADTTVANVSVAPHAPNFTFPVKDQDGNVITSGGVSVMPQAAWHNDGTTDWSQSIWLPIHKDGTVSGFLADGTYKIFSVYDGQDGFPVDIPFTILNGQATSPVTVAPPHAMLHGVLKNADGTPVQYAGILLAPTGSEDDPTKQVWLSTNGSGEFTDPGWGPNQQYASVLTSGTAYTVLGVSTSTRWVQLHQTMDALADGAQWNVTIPGENLTGHVSVDGKSVDSGWIAFGPSDTAARTGDDWHWVRISSGSYAASLEPGSYSVLAIQDDSNQQYYDETNRQQDAITVDGSTAQQRDVSFSNNFTGTVSGLGRRGATVEVSTVEHPSTSDEWQQVQYISTGASGNFNAYLDPNKTWYILGVSEPDKWTPVDQKVSLSSPTQLSVLPNVSGHVTWPQNGAPTAANAWVTLQDTQNADHVFSAKVDVSNNWSYATWLAAGTYKVLGVDVEASDGTHTWFQDNNNDTITAGTTPTTKDISESTVYNGTVAVDTAVQYVVFKNKASGEMVSVAVDSAKHFSTTYDAAGWGVVGAQTPENYYTATGTFSNGNWDVTVTIPAQ